MYQFKGLPICKDTPMYTHSKLVFCVPALHLKERKKPFLWAQAGDNGILEEEEERSKVAFALCTPSSYSLSIFFFPSWDPTEKRKGSFGGALQGREKEIWSERKRHLQQL